MTSNTVQRQGPVKKASEYRQHAKECRTLAAQAVSDEHRKQLAAMADTWDTLALEREKIAAKESPEFARSAAGAQSDASPPRVTH
jgi:hypothetical protein